jgi:hypothetical protein
MTAVVMLTTTVDSITGVNTAPDLVTLGPRNALNEYRDVVDRAEYCHCHGERDAGNVKTSLRQSRDGITDSAACRLTRAKSTSGTSPDDEQRSVMSSGWLPPEEHAEH